MGTGCRVYNWRDAVKNVVKASLSSAVIREPSETYELPLDTLNVKIRSLRLPDEDPMQFAIKVTYFDQLLVSSVIMAIGGKDKERTKILAEGTMNYDPSDYEKMCLFADCPLVAKTKICIQKRMEPMIKPPVLQCKSWDCLPLLTMEVSATRHKNNAVHHKHLKEANMMQLTLIAAYNLIAPPEGERVYTAISKTPLYCEFNTGLARFNEGIKASKKFNLTNFYAKWESLSVGENSFAKGDVKYPFNFKAIRNEDKLDLYPYLFKMPQDKKSVCLAVPLLWLNETAMMQECDCASLNVADNKAVSSSGTMQRPEKTKTESTASTEVLKPVLNDTGADENHPAFVIIEIKLARPLYKVVIPTRVLETDIAKMLTTAEAMGPVKRRCFGRIAFAQKWQSSVQLAATALRRVPYFGTTEFSVFVRQLSETKTRVELTTTCWQDGALFVNNNFVLQQYLHSDEIFEVTVNSPRDANVWRELSTCLKDIDRDWARVTLYNSILLNPRHPLTLLSTCGMVYEEDPVVAEQFFVALMAFYPYWVMGWIIASVYYYDRQQFLIYEKIMKIVQKSQREGQTEEIPYARGWERELGDWWDSTQLLPGMSPFYDAADVLLRLRCIALAELCLARSLSQAGESAVYYHMVALCCRLRGKFKEALCHVQVGINKYGDVLYLKTLEAECYHMLGNISDSMASYEKCSTSRWPYTVLMTLPLYTDPIQRRTVLWDLARRHPCAYTWMALPDTNTTTPFKSDEADNNKNEKPTSNPNAIACAVQALKCDRLAGRAWEVLANSVKPSARRHYCLKMASLCGVKVNKDHEETNADSRQSSCYRLGTAITECRCRACERLRL
ncbi:unnamed protein product [Arctia plantaginis]|uniref:Uncharacterized protein n=1 Tax=Arctia plantaginis TaxID=874455 RepID=A0A8S1ARY2_ARCPL|nr:unnamed protein product [Arctia plantaginis]